MAYDKDTMGKMKDDQETLIKEMESTRLDESEVEDVEDTPNTETDEEIIQECIERCESSISAMSDIHDDMETDMRFVKGDQWEENDRKDREAEGRPCLTINKLSQFVNMVQNDNRQNRPAVKVVPIDDRVDPLTAEVANGIIRHIQHTSDAESAYDTATDNAIMGGLGYFRILTDYIPNTFDSDIFVKRIENAFSVYFPIHLIQESDWSDAPYCHIVTKMERDEYNKKYGDNPAEWHDIGALWISDDEVTLCEYFVKMEVEKEIAELADGKIVDKKNVPSNETPVRTRKTYDCHVMWYLMSANKILDRKIFPSRWIPVIPVLGKEINIKGEKTYKSLVRDAIDPQRNYNYWQSMQTERIALAPKAPFIVVEGQLKGREKFWKTANRKNYAYLEYKPVSIGGVLAPPPHRQDPVSNDPAIIESLRESTENIKEATGMYNASLGNRSNETSGRAILARQREGDTATFHFADNTIRAMRHAYRIVVDLIPYIYDTERTVRILGEDMREKIVKVNQEYYDKTKNKNVLYDLRAGQYDVVVTTGANYATKRQETAENLLAFVQAVPVAGQLTADIIARNMDFPAADELAERLKSIIPPQVLQAVEQAKGDGGNQPPQPQGVPEEEVAQIVQDLQRIQQESASKDQVLQQLDQVIQKLTAELENKDKDRATQIEVATIKGEADVAKEALKVRSYMTEDLIKNIRGKNTAPKGAEENIEE